MYPKACARWGTGPSKNRSRDRSKKQFFPHLKWVPFPLSALILSRPGPHTPPTPGAPGWAQKTRNGSPASGCTQSSSFCLWLPPPSADRLLSPPFIPPGFVWCVYCSCVLSVSLLNHQLHETRTLSLLFTAGPPAFRTMRGVQLLFTEQDETFK